MTTRRAAAPLWMLVPAVLALIVALWAGLARLGWSAFATAPYPQMHGPMMVFGFLGTVISLERAVGLGRRWAFTSPVVTGLGVILLLVGLPPIIGAALILLGAVLVTAVYVEGLRIQPELHMAVMALGAVAWVVATAIWAGLPTEMTRIVPWMATFLVLTIVGERLELARMGGGTTSILGPFGWALLVYLVGTATTVASPDVGGRIAGAGMVALAFWMGSHDLARRTIRIPGLPRHIAVALLAGYGWLAVGGVLWGFGGLTGYGYDAALHAVFLGFVMSMIFAHAPIVVPGVFGLELPYHRVFYGHLVLLHVALLVRVIGSLTSSGRLWQWGGMFTVVAIVLFLGVTAGSVVTARHRS
ncbi:MAG TPA: hypothetical protein ENH00_09240 [Actinobacteria bacterium]|nr:hypothetical protein [Actinomycetota bacterium]HDL49552.1 hypothetical protein [Actinomycetota bacterium]